MSFEDLRNTLPALVVMTVIGVAVGAFLFNLLHENAASLTTDSFNVLVLAIPSVLMLIGTFVTLFFDEVNKSVLLANVIVCVVAGMIGLFIVSGWLSDASFTAPILANSGEDASMVSPVGGPLKIARDFAIFAFTPIVGSVAGAWVGSRIGFTR